MAKVIRSAINIALIALSMSLSSCGDEFALSEKYYYIKDSSKEWLVADSLVGKPFDMIDKNGISTNYSGFSQNKEFSTGTSGLIFLPMPTKKSYRENYYLATNSNYNHSFSMYLYASYGSGLGDELHFNFQDLYFHYNIESNKLTYLWSYQGAFDFNEESLQVKNPYASVEIKNNFIIRDRQYSEVLCFQIKDELNMRNNNDILAIYYAKGWGLVKYTYKNGLVVERKS